MDYASQLRKILNQIISSCQTFDRGIYDVAIQIAVSARILFHDTKRSKSLVRTHLGCPDIRLLSTCHQLGTNCFGLVDLQLTKTNIGFFRPRLEKAERQEEVAFDTWWSHEPIFKLFKSSELIYRKDLILTAANKDGGAHVDENLPLSYQQLIDGLGLAARVGSSKTGQEWTVTFRDAHLSALRQIGHEILLSPQLSGMAKTDPTAMSHGDILRL